MAASGEPGTEIGGAERRAGAENEAVEERRPSYLRQHRKAVWALVVVLLIALAGGWWTWSYYSVRESTDDAQIDGHIVPISARVGGTVAVVHVDDNQFVQAGTVLVEIDPRDYQVALDHARADLEAAQSTARAAQAGVPITTATSSSRLATATAGVRAAQAGVDAAHKEVDAARAQLHAAQARLREAQARETLARQNLERMQQLIGREEISRQQFDAATADAQSATAGADSARAAVAQAEQAVPVAESHVAQAEAALAQARAEVEAAHTAPQQIASSRAQSGSAQAKAEQNRASVMQAELNLQYTTIKAPVSGVVSRKTVEPGQVIQPGQPLLSLVPVEDIWVTANFKETQLKYMRVGQPVIIEVDAYGGREYRGHVDSLAAATGARFSLLPPENASGNYVKVVQRVPVKIVFEKGQDPEHLLRPGMSVTPTVRVK
ncbi:MAG TPA: HlyD family secretion protein [Bryobacteraceae bacterium]|nr:HlyD family secretion protein [Bryobacteraceae bacterium]